MNKLNSDPSKHPLIVTLPSPNQDDILRVVFEQLHSPLVSIVPEWKAICGGYNIDTCIYLNIGSTTTTLTPIYQGIFFFVFN